ncbi:aldo/keto reductase [Pseudomonas putida]|uniref:aldo/keto reductase n=1 Tax=Pseudomonas putida TaxID=303 RepID=UPI00226DA1B1|nr:aldo/keto reductase [Pseudomonas putida]WAB99785.1 aldo/keto reductase [Pseudomonas putida]
MSLDHYITLGRSGLRVSPLCLGAMTFGEELGWGIPPTAAQQIMDRYIELGGNFIDTANGYTKGHSEKIIGDHLAYDKQKRDRLVIATKFSTNLFPGDPNGGGSNRKSIIAACEESLRRLRTDYIDLYWLHNWDKYTPMEETVRAMNDLVDAGKVRYLGISDTPAWKAGQAQLTAAFRGWSPFIALQLEYSLAERTSEAEQIPMAQELGFGVMPWSPLAGGRLTGKYTRENKDEVSGGRAAVMSKQVNDKHFEIVDVLASIAQTHGATPAQIALAWVMGRPGVAAPITGVRTLEQLNQNVAALDIKLLAEELTRLDELTQPALPFPVGFLKMAPALHAGGTTINGESSALHAFCPTSASDRY